MNVIIKQQLIESVAKKLIEHADELTALDQAVGEEVPYGGHQEGLLLRPVP